MPAAHAPEHFGAAALQGEVQVRTHQATRAQGVQGLGVQVRPVPGSPVAAGPGLPSAGDRA